MTDRLETVGPWRRPRNLSADARGSIHDDATAEQLGFRGGTVAGNIHLVQCVPLLLDRFGNEWFETGTLSMMFRRATVDAEPVRVVLGDTDGDTGSIRIELEDGTITAEGSVSIGTPAPPSLLRRRDRRPVEPSSLEILSRIVPGAELPSRPVTLSGDTQRRLLTDGSLTEPLEVYSHHTPWGGPIASPLTEVDLLTCVEDDLRPLLPPGTVGLYGAIELSHHGHPVLIDRVYDVAGIVLAVSETPRTEVLWYESTASLDGEPVITMLMMSRLLRAA